MMWAIIGNRHCPITTRRSRRLPVSTCRLCIGLVNSVNRDYYQYRILSLSFEFMHSPGRSDCQPSRNKTNKMANGECDSVHRWLREAKFLRWLRYQIEKQISLGFAVETDHEFSENSRLHGVAIANRNQSGGLFERKTTQKTNS